VKMFQPLHCLNFGIGGDQTQHVLWRVENGEMNSVQPKVMY
jgi:platelet-activating factor acetylhydrolase IB subunit beta/gamma